MVVFHRISAWRCAPGRKEENWDISSEAPIGDDAAVTTPFIDEEPRVRDASRRFLEQLSRIAGIVRDTDHEGRSAYLPRPSRGIESNLRFHRGDHVGRVPVGSHPVQRSCEPRRCPGETLSERRPRERRR